MTSPGALLRFIRDSGELTRSELITRTGLARTTVGQRLEKLLACGFVTEAARGPSTGGRPPTQLRFNSEARVVVALELRATRARAAITDLAAVALAETELHVDLSNGPDAALERLDQCVTDLLDCASHDWEDVGGIGVGAPRFLLRDGAASPAPPSLESWRARSITQWFAARHDVPVVVEDTVNLMALGEQRIHWSDVDDLIYVHVDDEIVSGLIAAGEIHRGATGAAGDIGHIQMSADTNARCRCGRTGCLTALAGGAAIVTRLAGGRRAANTTHDVAALALAGDRRAVNAIRATGALIGETLALCVRCFNPGVVAIGGTLAYAHLPLIAAMQHVLFERSSTAATDDLRVVRSRLGDRAATIGAAVAVSDILLSPDAIDQTLAGRSAHSPELAFAGPQGRLDP